MEFGNLQMYIDGDMKSSVDNLKKDIYLNRLSGISNSILGKKSWRRPKID